MIQVEKAHPIRIDEQSFIAPSPAAGILEELKRAYLSVRFSKSPYELNPGVYRDAINYALENDSISHRGYNGDGKWIVRGTTNNPEFIALRASINATISTELLKAIDFWCSQKNSLQIFYKFTASGESYAAAHRHDSVTIYFVTKPSETQLRSLAQDLAPHIRGDFLLGTIVVPGFRIDSPISAATIQELYRKLTGENLYPIADAIRTYADRCFPEDGKRASDCPPGVYAAILEILKSRNISFP